MKKIEVKTYEMGESLFAAIIFLVFGIFLMTNPVDLIKVAMYILGGFITLLGIFKLLIYYKVTDGNKKEIINGGVYIILGMATILCVAIFYDTVETVLRFLIAIYLLYVGINRLVSVFKVKTDKRPYYINAFIIILISLCLAFIPGLPLIVVGIFITLYAIAEIVGFVLGRKSGYTPAQTVSEAVIVSEQITTNSEDVKLLK